jgi:hypothetical protein
MSHLDYYTFDLLPCCWHRDGTVTRAFRQFLQQQERRFPARAIVETLLVGDVTQHYWTDKSPVDVLVRVVPEHQQEVVGLAEQMVGKVAWQNHPVEWFPVQETRRPDQLAERFGPVYSVNRGVWHGVVPHDTEELLRPSGLVRKLAWMQYRALRLREPDPYDWRLEKQAFREQKAGARFRTLALLRHRAALQQRHVRAALQRLDRSTWKAATEFEQQLETTGAVPDSRLPLAVQRHLVSWFRWRWLIEDLEELDQKSRRLEQAAAPR